MTKFDPFDPIGLNKVVDTVENLYEKLEKLELKVTALENWLTLVASTLMDKQDKQDKEDG